MKSKLILAALIASSSLAVMAQEKKANDADGRHYVTTGFFKNWYLGVGGGVNLYEGDYDSNLSLGKRMAPALDVTLEKWITPYIGIRLGATGLKAKGLAPQGALYANNVAVEGFYEKEFNLLGARADLMWNVLNGLSAYNEKRLWSPIPYAGFGVYRSFANNASDNNLGLNFGLLNVFRLNSRLGITLDIRQLITSDSFDQVSGGSGIEGMSSVTVGLRVALGKNGFKRAGGISEKVQKECNDHVNALREQNRELNSKNVTLNTELEVKNQSLQEATKALQLANEKVAASNETGKTRPVPVALFFKLGKATLDAKELANLLFYMKSAGIEKGATFTLTGTADATGSKEANLRLSKKRVEYVYQLLVSEYNVAPERIKKNVEGDSNQRFDNPELNRTVIIENK